MNYNWFVLFLLHHAACFPLFGQRHVSIMAYEDCQNLPSTVIIRNNLTISATGRGKTIANGYLNVTEDVVLDTVMADLYSCGEQITLQTENCEYMLKTSQSKPCVILEDKTQFWSPFIASIKPPVTCVGNTFPKNIYRVINGTFQVTPKNKIFLPDNHWILKVQYLNEKKEIIECVTIQVDIYTSRS